MKDVLVVYFSGTDAEKSATAEVARNLASIAGADLHEIRLERPYATDYPTLIRQAQNDKDTHARPALAGPDIVLEPYSTILLGFPNWCGTAPMPVFSFLDTHEKNGTLAAKRIVPFVLNDGAGMQNAVSDLQTMYPDAIIEEGRAFENNKSKDASELAIEWIKEIM